MDWVTGPFLGGNENCNSFLVIVDRNRDYTPKNIVEVEVFPGPVRKITKAGKIRLNGNDHRQCFVIFKNQTAAKDEWLPDGDLQDSDPPRGLNSLINVEPFFRGRVCHPVTQTQRTIMTAKIPPENIAGPKNSS
ncbi:hypothetical protein O181_003076 [Austropuccinia psidii MF-1]|uniref:Uncharacterized protein n=1 Tax=Austropuccinia psidii MF-1 TaxID=1389203 RepID=A0A9Q3GDT5_9BASI|nr:hypothetical protein [Austropuccinia psidii MF-1]